MRLAIDQCTVQLDSNKPMALRGARGVWVECVAGTLWLTVAGHPGDFFLRASERLLIESDGLVVVEGLPQGALRLSRDESAVRRPVWSFGGLAQAG